MSTDVESVVDVTLKRPQLYKVVLLNDDFTPMPFVVDVLVDVFNKSLSEARALTLEVHEKGRGIAGVFTKEIAEQKVDDTITVASHYGHPLKAISEPS
jgi:ATP-dependent Clp protease adaptor protein ClpS